MRATRAEETPRPGVLALYSRCGRSVVLGLTIISTLDFGGSSGGKFSFVIKHEERILDLRRDTIFEEVHCGADIQSVLNADWMSKIRRGVLWLA